MIRNRKILIMVVALFVVLNISHLSIGRAESVFNAMEGGIEKEIGYYSYYSISRQKQSANLPESETRRLNSIFSKLVANSSRNRDIEFKLTVINDPTINAFALPGGYVFLNTGLLSFANTDAEIAGVLGHEIAHVDRKHGMKALYRTAGMSAVWGMVIHKNNGKYKETLNRMAGVSIALVQLGYSREAEFEADDYGVRLMTSAWYNKADLLNFWNRVSTEQGNNELPGFFQMFSTHPPLAERIQRIEKLE